MKDGHALCVNCGREPSSKPEGEAQKKQPSNTVEVLEKKLELLSKELETEQDYERQQAILKSINSLIDTIERLKGSKQ